MWVLPEPNMALLSSVTGQHWVLCKVPHLLHSLSSAYTDWLSPLSSHYWKMETGGVGDSRWSFLPSLMPLLVIWSENQVQWLLIWFFVFVMVLFCVKILVNIWCSCWGMNSVGFYSPSCSTNIKSGILKSSNIIIVYFFFLLSQLLHPVLCCYTIWYMYIIMSIMSC